LNVHTPETHAGWALATVAGHRTPQLAQLFGSVVLSTQTLLQIVGAPAGQPFTQLPFEQTGVFPPQARPHEPQLLLSLVRSMQAPEPPLQNMYPGLHPIPQLPFEQLGYAFATLVAQTLPHVLQLLTSLCVLVQTPPQSF
jgi:hypothetical protein